MVTAAIPASVSSATSRKGAGTAIQTTQRDEHSSLRWDGLKIVLAGTCKPPVIIHSRGKASLLSWSANTKTAITCGKCSNKLAEEEGRIAGMPVQRDEDSKEVGGSMDLFDMLLLWAHMQCGHLDTDMESMTTLETPVAAIFVVLVAAFSSFCCPTNSNCSGSSSGHNNNTANPRKLWKPRQSTYWDTMVQRQRSWSADEKVRDSYWQAQYRMSYGAFQTLIAELTPFIERSNNTVRDTIELDRAVAMVLHRLAFGLPPSTIANLYNIGKSTVTEYTKQITEILSSRDKLYSKFVSIPSGAGLASTIAKFQDMTDIPNICGAIDGTHIKLWRKPRLQDVPKFYWNNYEFYSILLQGVCDADKVFWDVCCNAPGGVHDDVHLRSSSLWQKLKSERVLEQPVALVQGRTVRPVLVGDTDYPLAPFLITPFQTPGVPAAELQQDFDAALMKAHSCVGSAFGILKKRWGILANLNIGLQYAPQVVVACCVLHNFCQLAGEKEPEDHIDIHLNNNNNSDPRHQSDHESMVEHLAGRAYREVLFSEWAERRSRCTDHNVGKDDITLASIDYQGMSSSYPAQIEPTTP